VRGMDGSGEAYQYLIQRLGEVLPDVAAKIQAEVARGRVVAGSKLSSAEREARETRMHEANVGRIAQADVAPVAYTDDERLALLVDSLIRVAATMQSSRHALLALNRESAFQKSPSRNRMGQTGLRWCYPKRQSLRLKSRRQ
jgi:hypothetical protein